MNNNVCCLIKTLNRNCEQISKQLCQLNESLLDCKGEINNNLTTIISMLSHDFPITILAEFPTETKDKIIYSVNIRFLDLRNSSIFILFKGVLNINKPVYIKDISGFEHIVSLTNGGVPIKANTLINNITYKCDYIGNYIVLCEESLPDTDLIKIK